MLSVSSAQVIQDEEFGSYLPSGTEQCSIIEYLSQAHDSNVCYTINSHPIPCFTLEVLSSLREFLAGLPESGPASRFASRTSLIATMSGPGYDCLGGDLEFFIKSIRARDVNALATYAELAVDVLLLNYEHRHGFPLTVALVRGTTIGAGFEAALSCDLIVAERGTRMGFPEVLFNMFPGMGGISFLSRRISPALAQRMILSGKLFRAEELHELGVVDHLVEPGLGLSQVYQLANNWKRSLRSRMKVSGLMREISTVSADELRRIGEEWVSTAFELSERDLGNMERLLAVQRRRYLHCEKRGSK